jgi:hypothetical protein
VQFSYSRTTLLTIDEPVVAPKGLVYSTSPRRAEGDNGRSYFIKGHENNEAIFAEIGGCILANAVGLPVPAVALCDFEDAQFAGSEDLGGIRDVSAWLAWKLFAVQTASATFAPLRIADIEHSVDLCGGRKPVDQVVHNPVLRERDGLILSFKSFWLTVQFNAELKQRHSKYER